MKVLVIHNHYQRWGGESAAASAQIALLRSAGHTVTAYARDNAEISEYRLLDKCAFFWRSFRSAATYRDLRRRIAHDKPDVVHIHNVFPLITPSAYIAAHDVGLPIVQTLHNFRLLCPNALFFTHGLRCERCMTGNTLHAIRHKCYRGSYILSALYAGVTGLHRARGTWGLIDRFVVLTEFTAQKLVDSGLTTHDRIRVLGNFLPEPLPQPGPSAREPYLVYMGRLSPEKGVETVIRAMAYTVGLRLLILGDGPQRDELADLVGKRGSSIEFRGHVTGDAKWEILRRAAAVVVPSECYENFPMTVLESYGVGTPVIASDLGSLPFVVQNGETGILFSPGDPRDLAQAITSIVDNPEWARSMGLRARQVVEKHYSSQAHYEQLMSIYSEVMR